MALQQFGNACEVNVRLIDHTNQPRSVLDDLVGHSRNVVALFDPEDHLLDIGQ